MFGTVYYYSFNKTGSSSVSFIIDTTPPSVTISSVEDKTYSKSEIQLNFTTSEPVSQISYVLDGQENVTIDGNTTLSGLSSGLHNITVYARDEFENTGVSETISFSVDVPEPFPTTLVIASIASVVVVGVGLLVYFRKRRK
jgi:hypothetical protein